MTEPMWWIVGAYLLVATTLLAGNARPRAYEGAVLRFQESVGVELPHDIGEQLRKRMLVNRRSGLIGGMVGLLVSAVIVSSRTSDPGAIEMLILAAGAFAGPALAVSIVTLINTRKPATDQVRYARAQAVRLSDYVSGLERWLPRGLVAVVILYFATWGIATWLGLLPRTSVSALISGVLFALGAVATLLIFEIAGRRIVAMGNRVGSPDELVWEDAIRARTVRDISGAPALVGMYAVLFGLPSLVGQGTAAGFLHWVGIAVIACVLLVVLIMVILRPERHFLRKLWPELAATTGKPYGPNGSSKPQSADATGKPYSSAATGKPYDADAAGKPYGANAAGMPSGANATGQPSDTDTEG